MDDERLTEGKRLAELIWWSLAKHIVRKAGELYKWDDAEWLKIQEIFLRNNDYTVTIT